MVGGDTAGVRPRASRTEAGLADFGGGILRRRGPAGYAMAFVWLGFLVVPLINAIEHSEPPLAHVATIVATALFVASYVWLVLVFRRTVDRQYVLLVYMLAVAIAIALTLADRPGWGFLFTYCGAVTAILAPPRLVHLGVGLCVAVLAGGISLLGGASGAAALGFVASTAGVGLFMILMRDLRTRNDELVQARAELARMAVAEERERFARDLHDLLGHSLSVIALKAQLAGRLLPGRPEDASREIGEVESVARSALSEVRDAVSRLPPPDARRGVGGAR